MMHAWNPGKVNDAAVMEEDKEKKATETVETNSPNESALETARQLGYHPWDSTHLTAHGTDAYEVIRRVIVKHMTHQFVTLDNNLSEEKKTELKLICKESEFWTGGLQTGKRAMHQDLHVDNVVALEKKAMRDYMENRVSTFKECWDAGYVCDIPLSKEGLVVRILYPSQDGKNLLMDYIYCPFGSVLVRSACIFHSGHYGSPGNFRAHGVLCKKETRLMEQSLAFFDTFSVDPMTTEQDKKKCVFWADHIPPNKRQADQAMEVVRTMKRNHSGFSDRPFCKYGYSNVLGESTRCYNRIIENRGYGTSHFTKICLSILNPKHHFEVVAQEEETNEKKASLKVNF
jgi:hypothetical protein